MAKNFRELERVIRSQLPPERYGLRNFLFGDVYQDAKGFYILRDRNNLSRGWECSDGAITVSNVLRSRGIENRICVGNPHVDVTGVHVFVVDKDGIIYDPTPFYPFIGAGHKVLREVEEEEVEKNKLDNKIGIQGKNVGQTPVTWYRESYASFHLVSVGQSTHEITGLDKRFTHQLGFLEMKFSRFSARYLETIAAFDPLRYNEKGYTPQLGLGILDSIERLGEFKRKGILELVSHTYPKDIIVSPDMSQMLQDNFNVFCSLIEKISSLQGSQNRQI